LGRTLHYLFQRMTVEPLLDGGQFVGWQVVRLDQPEFWDTIDLRLGDVVTAVNDLPIERETEAYDAFASLKRAEQLRITLLRGGERLELVFKIVDRGGRRAKPKPGGGTKTKPRLNRAAGAKLRLSRNVGAQ
jgi:type II secretory pathway component PulC